MTPFQDDGIVVVEVKKGETPMAASRIPTVVRDRLGDDATFGVIELLDSERKDWSAHVLGVAADRFDRRLTEEISGLRIEFHKALHEGMAAVRQEMQNGLTSVRQEMHDGFASVRQEIATARVDMLKWSFLFWIGQIAAIAGLLSLMLRR